MCVYNLNSLIVIGFRGLCVTAVKFVFCKYLTKFIPLFTLTMA